TDNGVFRRVVRLGPRSDGLLGLEAGALDFQNRPIVGITGVAGHTPLDTAGAQVLANARAYRSNGSAVSQLAVFPTREAFIRPPAKYFLEQLASAVLPNDMPASQQIFLDSRGLIRLAIVELLERDDHRASHAVRGIGRVDRRTFRI